MASNSLAENKFEFLFVTGSELSVKLYISSVFRGGSTSTGSDSLYDTNWNWHGCFDGEYIRSFWREKVPASFAVWDAWWCGSLTLLTNQFVRNTAFTTLPTNFLQQRKGATTYSSFRIPNFVARGRESKFKAFTIGSGIEWCICMYIWQGLVIRENSRRARYLEI